MDLDGDASNGAESQCDLNVLQTFPVQIETKVTNKAVGDAYNFQWPSAGPGGFSSSVTPGSTGGVGAKWVWTTNQSVFSYTGSSCPKDICFLQTAGTNTAGSYCTDACVDDGIPLTLSKNGTAGQVVLTWSGNTGPYTIYRSPASAGLATASNQIGTTSQLTFTDQPPDGSFYYKVTGQSCNVRKSCSSNADCSLPGDGTCSTRGPFGAPGRSLYTTDVTVSAASLTSSLITFFSPPREVFRVTSSVAPGGSGVAFQETLTNVSNQPVTVQVAGYPPGCCTQEHQLNCDGTCVDYLTDPNHCGSCDTVCDENSHCSEGSCVPNCPEGQTLCGDSCVDLNSDRANCGACGNVCETIYTGRCEGPGCPVDQICVEGTCTPCTLENHTACDNTCVNVGTDPNHCGICTSVCIDRCPEGTVSAYCNGGGSCCCVQPDNSEVCVPSFDSVPSGFGLTIKNPPTPSAPEAPLCETPPSTNTIPPGGTSTDCLVAGVLAKEVPTSVTVCGDDIPDGSAHCPNGDPASQGTFMKLIPDLSKPIGNAFLTPYAVQVSEPSNDGMIEPGETAKLTVSVINAGPLPITGAQATLLSPAVDLSDDGVDNPIALTLPSASFSYGTIAGTPTSTDCVTPAQLTPAQNSVPMQVTFPANHPGDTSRPFVLHFTGTVADAPFVMDMPLALGIADKCDVSLNTRDFDGLDGLLSPMEKLTPVGDPVIFPNHSFTAGNTRPMKLKVLCNGVNLDDSAVDAPEIVGLSEATRGELDIHLLNLNADNGSNPNDPFFKFSNAVLSGSQWNYNMRTALLGTGTFTVRIRIASRKVYAAGFVLQ